MRDLARALVTEPDAGVREIALEGLRTLAAPGPVEAATDVLVDNGNEQLARALAAAPTLPADPGRRALVLFLAGDRSQPAPAVDVLRATIASTGTAARARIVARARAEGRVEWIRATARPHRGTAATGGPSDDGWDARIAALASPKRGHELWQRLPDAAPVRAAEALRALDRAGWQARSAAERRLFELVARCSAEPPPGVTYTDHAVSVADSRSIGPGSVLSPDGRILAVPGAGNVGLRLWRLPHGEPLGTVGPPTNQVIRLPDLAAFSPDGRLLACLDGHAADHASIGLWDVPSCEPLAVLTGMLPVPESLMITPDGGWLIGLSWTYEAQLRKVRELTFWRLPDGRHERTLPLPCRFDHHELVTSPDGSVLMACCDQGIHRWTLPPVEPLPGLSAEVHALLSSSPDGRTVVIRGREGVQVRRVPEGDVLGEVPLAMVGAGPQVHRGLTPVSPDGRFLLASPRHGPATGEAERYELPSGRPVEPLRGTTGRIEHIAVTVDGRVVAGGSTDGRVRLWSQSSGELLGVLDGAPNQLVLTVLAAQDTVVGLAGSTIVLWPALLPQLARTPLRAVTPTDVDRLRRAPDELLTADERAWTALLTELVGWCHRYDIEVADPGDATRPGADNIELDPPSGPAG